MQRQGAITAAVRPSQQPHGISNGVDMTACVLDATRALCNFALQANSDDNARAMSILVGLVFTIGHADEASPHATSGDILFAVPLHQVLAAATQSIAHLDGVEALHGELLRSQYPAVALALVQQLAICSSIRCVPPSADTYVQLLRFTAALDASQPTQLPMHSVLPPAGNTSERPPGLLNPSREPGTDTMPCKAGNAVTPAAETVAFGPRCAVVTAHQVATRGPTLRLGGQSNQAIDRRPSQHQVAVAGYSGTGKRLPCAVMQRQVTRVLALLLGIPKPPEHVLVTVLTSQQAQLHHRVHAFCDLLFAEPGSGTNTVCICPVC